MITAELLHPNASGSGALGTSDLPWGAIHAVQLYKNGLAVATLQSPALTGTPTAPTPASAADHSTRIATTAFVQAVLAALEISELSSGETTVTATDLAAHLGNGAIHLTAEQVRDLVAAFATGSTSLAVNHDDAGDALNLAVRLKSSGLSAEEGQLQTGVDGLTLILGTDAHTAAAGNDARFPSAAEKAGLRVHQFAASSDPTEDDDSGDGYAAGSVWLNTLASPARVFLCVDASTGEAVWERLNASVSILELDNALTDALLSSPTIEVTHDEEARTFAFGVVAKSSSLGTLEQRLSATGTGLVGVLGTSANTACAGNDGRLRQHRLDATLPPENSDDSTLGYGVGSLWILPLSGEVYLCTDDAEDAATWGLVATLPASDSAPLVRHASEASRQLRIDIEAVSDNTTRVLTMPDADIDLTPNAGSYIGAMSANGLLARTSAGNYAARSISVTANCGLAIANGGGAGGNPTLDVDIQALTEKATPAADDVLLLEDSAASYAQKKVKISSLGGSSLPVADSAALVKGSSDATKQVRLEVDGLSTATTRVITMPDADVNLAPNSGSYIGALGSNGFAARTSSGNYAARTITAGSGISVTNGDGVGGNVVIAATGGGGGGGGAADAVQFTGYNNTGGNIGSPGALTAVTITNDLAGDIGIAAASTNVGGTPAVGVILETLADSTPTTVTVFGAISGIDTSAFSSVGTVLWVGHLGALTPTKPTGNSTQQPIAIVTVFDSSAGEVLVIGGGLQQNAGIGSYLSSGGIQCRTGAMSYAGRTISAGSTKISVNNGDGVSGNPSISLATNYQNFTVPAAAMTPAGTNGAAPGTRHGTNVSFDHLAFDAATDESAFFFVRMPDDWDRGALKVKLNWTSSATTGNVVWNVLVSPQTNDETFDPSLSTTTGAVTDGMGNAAYDIMISPVGTLSSHGAALEDVLVFQVKRDADSGSDTLSVDALLLSLEVQYAVSGTVAAVWS